MAGGCTKGDRPRGRKHHRAKNGSDVLDTWAFSSALWPFSHAGLADKTAELEKVRQRSGCTGYDISFFGCRMMMFGTFVGDGFRLTSTAAPVPFACFCIRLVRDESLA